LFTSEKHHARTLHYDLRLEKDGVFQSWAVPKGVPEEVDVKRLAIQVDDHALEFGDFEGEIPAGEYGAGHVEIWDRGTYESASWSDDVVRQAF
jgi:bifunctional non-homologous end joining protein LigD